MDFVPETFRNNGFFKDKHVDGIIGIYDLLCYTQGDVRKTVELLLPILSALKFIPRL
ncbi:hypothetical protein GCM10011539_00070 [Finegoldia magna]